MGVDAYNLVSALNGVVAQRLTRTVCPSCATKYFPVEHVLRDAGLEDMAGRTFQKGLGCQQCHDTGFKGRLGIYEVMEITPELRRLVHHSSPTHELRARVRQQGMLTLREEGVVLALDGKTSLEEVLRVTHLDDEEAAPAKGSAAEEKGGTGVEDAATRKEAA
jgi:type II secretory ATPase GspE/PulE/Tfp pilus assembly ATPase PilB-like protein